MAETRQIITDEQARKVAEYIVGLHLPVTITIREGLVRTNPQNDLQWQWCEEIARHRGDTTAPEVQRENKLYTGCPILMRDDPAFRLFAESLSGLTHEQKLEAMDYVPVTSRMTVKQMREYLDAVYAKWVRRGVKLTEPEAA